MGGQDVGFLHVRTADEDDGPHRRGLHGGAREAPPVSRSRTSARCTRDRRDARGWAARRQHTRPGLDLRLPTTRFRGNQNLVGVGLVPARHASRRSRTRQQRLRRSPSNYPNDRWIARRQRPRGAGRTSTRRSASSRAATIAATTSSLAFGPASRQQPRGPAVAASAAAWTLHHRPAATTCSSATSTCTLLNMQFQSQDKFCGRARATTSGSTRRSPSARGITLPDRRRVQLHPRFAVSGQTANRRDARPQRAVRDRRLLLRHRAIRRIAGLTVRARPGYIFSLNGEWNQRRPGRGPLQPRNLIA